MDPQLYPWIILFTPLAAAGVILFVFSRRPTAAGSIAVVAAVLACFLSWRVFLDPSLTVTAQIPWIEIPGVFSVPIGIILDNLSRVMLVVVTSIATLVFIYSAGYMRGDEGIPRYYAALCLFLFSMLGIVLADNFVMMFIFWELVGVSSYILIGHYFRKNSAADAGKQAFLVNRVGDFGFMLGILMLWLATGSVVFSAVEANLSSVTLHPGYLTAACLLVFCGTIGKSAQMPLHVWLPNSMEGPTPVSSLLHAATMVAAGVYMLARIFPVLLAAPEVVREVILWIGAVTCFAAGLMATQQDDIKRILAYSTISQLGYMVVGIGVASTADAAMFHLFTHAFFKCLLFLCAGSVIIALHHEQDIWKMGGLLRRMPVTALCMLAGGLALAGTPFFSGSFSKDNIIEWAWMNNRAGFWVTASAVFLTAIYTFRLLFVVFLGRPRGEHAEHAKESPLVMTLPLVILAVPAVIAGYPWFRRFFFEEMPHAGAPAAAHTIILAFLGAGAVLAALLYLRGPAKDPVRIPLFANRLYIDNFYDWLVARVQGGLAVLSSWFDRWIIDGVFATGAARTVWAAGYVLRLLQVGNLQAYAFFFGAGVVAVLYFLVFR
ncbi:MAG: NADH-quinone oxidoreductase subunit L [Chthoniobacterales bacterium]|nr:NADH-quinone oxidoreductase subunit L [Chthoniobacterales bacterium]